MALIAASVFPVIVILIYLYYRDKYEKEPLKVLLKAFMGGVLAIFTTLLIAMPLGLYTGLQDHIFHNSLYQSFVLAALPEELSKFLFLYILIWKDKNFNEYYDGIIYAVFVSMGFACIENILYVLQGGYGVALGRAIFAVPAHAFFGVIMGYYFAHAKFGGKQKNFLLFKGVALAILAHGIYNFLLFYSAGISEFSPPAGTLIMLVFIVFVIKLHQIGFRKIKKHVEASVFK